MHKIIVVLCHANRFAIVVLLFFITTIPPTYCQCDFYGDSCPWQVDGVCDDASINPDATELLGCFNGGDCVDCDPCGAFHFTSCTECVANGCVWCPGNAFCSSEALNQADYFNQFGDGALLVACPNLGDWNSACAADANSIFSDPLYGSMEWSFDLMNVQAVWEQGIFGDGVHIRVNDEGVDATHPEFSSKFSVEGSCTDYLNLDDEADHGTAAASVAAATANNGECSAGIAPNAIVSSCNLFGNTFAPNLDAYVLGESQLAMVDISSNSWGEQICVRREYIRRRRRRLRGLRQLQTCPFSPVLETSPCNFCNFAAASLSTDCTTSIYTYCRRNFKDDEAACTEFFDVYVQCEYDAMTPADEAALIEGTTSGRNGLGIIYVFASGNEYFLGQDVNFDGWLNTRYTISVGAVGRDGLHSDYSTAGAALFCSAPGGDTEYLTNNIVAQPGGGCKDITIGTSFACPAVSGVIALILEVNSALTWRDVQGIIALTSQMTDNSSPSWITNAANFHHSYLYGFGIVDAAEAVNVARTWENFENEESLTGTSGTVNLPIADDAAVTVISTVPITWSGNNQQSFITESVVVHLELEHPSRGDLDIRLTSPQGTESILHPGKRPESSPLQAEWELMTVRTWGEDPVGDWTLEIADQRLGDLTEGCVDLPYSVPVGDVLLTCELMVVNEFCRDGTLLNDVLGTTPDSNGNFADVSCCVCGGGVQASAVRDILVSWAITVYGRVGDAVEGPVDPVDPVDPGDPVDPVDPGDPEEPEPPTGNMMNMMNMNMMNMNMNMMNMNMMNMNMMNMNMMMNRNRNMNMMNMNMNMMNMNMMNMNMMNMMGTNRNRVMNIFGMRRERMFMRFVGGGVPREGLNRITTRRV